MALINSVHKPSFLIQISSKVSQKDLFSVLISNPSIIHWMIVCQKIDHKLPIKKSSNKNYLKTVISWILKNRSIRLNSLSLAPILFRLDEQLDWLHLVFFGCTQLQQWYRVVEYILQLRRIASRPSKASGRRIGHPQYDIVPNIPSTTYMVECLSLWNFTCSKGNKHF